MKVSLLLVLAAVLAGVSCERQSFDETRKLHEPHGHHGAHGEAEKDAAE